MHHVNTVRKAALAVAALSATLAVTACQPSDSASGTGGSSPTPSASASASSSTPASSAPSSAPSTPPATASPASHSSAGSGSGSGSSGTAPKTCAATALDVTAHQAANRPVGTGTGAAVFEFTNTSKQTCVLQGHPTVAGAGNGSPQHNAPLKVTPTGTATQVKLAPGGKAWLKLTFVQVQGEADGYCKSGATPTTYPTMVIGLPGAGSHQVALDDGVFAECDNTVTATAVSGAALS
ncbi:DUF4232 domain-containing protein [Streptomyces sp. SLBN-31]|jgi:hypothetical protein|uniref:DUF4232 domain-containing protein n=1 Tax=Streptomyces sp. SLBN-31 TaxID=2768444 RepID=UPI00115449F9|nr:DUF4232 domain-containing protein [Streptomyces sp. SLBN-31]TQJ87715.1 uncharacterized protein DUF4232 [Streptomyces sp. SLBN-31]